MNQIKIFDTTLRDGEQSPGCSMNLKEKIEVAKCLERLKVDVIEAGFAISSPGDFESVKTIAETVRDCSVASLARATQKDIDCAWEAVKNAADPRIHVFLATSPLHMEYKLKMTPEQVLARTAEMVKYAKQYTSNIEFSCEDATRSDTDFLIQVVNAAVKNGATVINLPDTVGYTTPDEMRKLIEDVMAGVENSDKVEFSVHCHNDLGMAVANSLAGVLGGARQIECTINGLGERAGNTAMDAARVAKRMGAHATILYRRTKKFMPADEHELQLAIDEGVEFIELAAPVKQAKGMLLCDKMVLGEPDTSGRRSPVKSGEQFSIPCDLVLSAVGEQVDSDLMAANGIEMERKGPAFETNVEGVYCAGDAHRGPATLVEGIADAARFAEAVIGAPYEYEIPAQAFITESDAIAKHGILKMSGKCEGERCLQCSTVCENCVDSCPNRANVAVVMPDESHQIIHVDKMCNECGNCTQFCPYASEPCHDKFTLFQTAEDMAESKNPGVLFLDADHVRVRMAEERDYDLTTSDNDLPVDIEALIFTIRDKYSYLFA